MEVKKICVLGVGTIGYQIAQLAAQHGYNVVLRDVDNRIVQNGAQKEKEERRKLRNGRNYINRGLYPYVSDLIWKK